MASSNSKSNNSKAFLEWRDAWLLGNNEIDEQHLGMVELLNLIADTRRPDSHELLLQLREETRQHFGHEESMMRDYDYPDIAGHHREHAVLLADLQDFIREIDAGTKTLDRTALTSLKHWLIDHILTSDRQFVRYLRQDAQNRSEEPDS